MQPDLAITSIERLLEKVEGQEKIKLLNALEEKKRSLTNFLEHEIVKTLAAFMNSDGSLLMEPLLDNSLQYIPSSSVSILSPPY